MPFDQWSLGECGCPAPGGPCNGHTIPATLHYSATGFCCQGPYTLTYSLTAPPAPACGGAVLPNAAGWWSNPLTDCAILMSCAGGGVHLAIFTCVFGAPPAWQSCTLTGIVASYTPFSASFSVNVVGCGPNFACAGFPDFTITVTG